MRKLLKLLGIVVGAAVVLLVVAALGVALLFDPNDYRDEITAAVERTTGRELTLEGDLELDLFPGLTISVGRARLANAEGFGDQPFAEIERAALDIALLPLLRRQIEIGEATLDGLVLNLARDAQGRDNWQDLGGAADDEAAADGAPTQPDGERAPVDLAVDVIRVSDSRVTWADEATGSEWTLGDFDFEASDFGPETAFPVTTSFTLAGDDLDVAVGAQTRATLSLADNAYRLDDLRVSLTGDGAAWPGGEGEARLAFDVFAADLDSETLDLQGLTLEFLGLTVNGTLEGRSLLSDLALDGRVQIEPFDPGELLETFDVAVETADPGVLRHAAAEAAFVYDAARVGLSDMQLELDESQLVGSVGMDDETLRFDLDVDEINVDRYLPPADEESAGAAGDEGSLDEVDLPLDALSALDAEGSLRFGAAQFSGMSLTDAAFTLQARDGRVRLTPTASLYGGSLAADVGLDVGADAAQTSFAGELSDVDMLPLGRDLLDSEMVSGRGDLRLDLTSAGSNVGEIRRDLDGDVAFTLSDGAWEGFDLWFELVRALRVFEGEGRPERPDGPRRTPFESVSATGVVEDALLTNRDLNATLPFMTVDGAGTVNLVTDEIDFDLVATFVDGETLQSEPSMARLAGEELPLVVTGTVTEPSVRPDFAAMLRSRAGEEITERLQEERGEADERAERERAEAEQRVESEREELEQRAEEEAEEVREEVRDRLRGIFE